MFKASDLANKLKLIHSLFQCCSNKRYSLYSTTNIFAVYSPHFQKYLRYSEFKTINVSISSSFYLSAYLFPSKLFGLTFSRIPPVSSPIIILSRRHYSLHHCNVTPRLHGPISFRLFPHCCGWINFSSASAVYLSIYLLQSPSL